MRRNLALLSKTLLALLLLAGVLQCSPAQKKQALSEPTGPAYLGILYTDTLRGSLVRQVFAHSPAHKSGLQPGDWITEAGPYRAGGMVSLHQTIRQMQPGDELRLVYMRGSQMHSTVAVLETAPANLQPRRLQSPGYQMPRSIYGR